MTHHSIARKTLRHPQLDIAKLRQLRDSLSSSLGRRNAVHKSGWQTVTPEKRRVCKTKAPSDSSLIMFLLPLEGTQHWQTKQLSYCRKRGIQFAACSLAKFCAAKYIDMSRGSFNKVIQCNLLTSWDIQIPEGHGFCLLNRDPDTIHTRRAIGVITSPCRTRTEVSGSFGHELDAIWNGNCRNSILSENTSLSWYKR